MFKFVYVTSPSQDETGIVINHAPNFPSELSRHSLTAEQILEDPYGAMELCGKIPYSSKAITLTAKEWTLKNVLLAAFFMRVYCFYCYAAMLKSEWQAGNYLGENPYTLPSERKLQDLLTFLKERGEYTESMQKLGNQLVQLDNLSAKIQAVEEWL